MHSNNLSAPQRIPISTTLADFFDQWYVRDHDIMASTVEGYRLHLRRFERWLMRTATIADLSEQVVNAYIRHVCETQRPDTARGASATLQAIWRHAIAIDSSIGSPAMILKPKRERASRRSVKCWDREQVRSLLAAVDSEDGEFKGKQLPRAAFWRAYILAVYDTGLQPSSLFKLTAGDIPMEGPLVVHNHRGRPIEIPITELTRQAILATDPGSRPFVFRVLDRRYFFKVFKQIVKAAGLTGTSEYLRRARSFAERIPLEETFAPVPPSMEPAVPPVVEPTSAELEAPGDPEVSRPPRTRQKPCRERQPREPASKWRSAAAEPGGPETLYQYFARIYRPKRLLGKSPRTSEIYAQAFDRFGDYLGRAPTLADLNEEAVCGFLEWRLSNGRAHHTVDKESDKLLAMSNYAAKKRHIPEFLDVPRINPAEILPTCWRREQVEQLFRACREAKGKFGRAPRCIWWIAFHALCLSTGERTEAMLQLRWDMLQGMTLSVPAEIRKGKRKAARYLLPSSVVEELEHLRPFTEGRIFAAPWLDGASSFYRHYTVLLERAGLPTSRRFKPQCLRRTFASFLEAGGGDATEALQHSDRSVTRESYLDTGVTQAGKEAASAIVWRQLGLSSRPLAITHEKSSEAQREAS